jgi:signal transduction histidine kinase
MTLALPGSRPASATDQVETTLFRALAVLRLVVLVYAVALNAARWEEFARPVLGWTVVAVMVVWTAFVTWAYDDPGRRRTPLLVADLAVAAGALLSTPLVHSDAMLERHASSMPSFWVMAAVLAWAVARGWVGGVLAAASITVCDLSVRLDTTGTTWGNIFLLFLAAGVVGYSTTRLREATEARAHAERIAATLEERARLARIVHDGVLQVLALVQRRGLELGGDAADLGRLAGEQEVALRALVQGNTAALTSGPVPDGDVDLVERLSALATRTVTVSGPAGSVLLPASVVEELGAVVRACLDNVARHVGEDAAAWVLVEDLGDSVVVTVRDEGSGIPEGRLEAAEAEGRMGVSGSIRGRMADLGGSATLMTAPGAGTEWELEVPRRPQDAGGVHSK